MSIRQAANAGYRKLLLLMVCVTIAVGTIFITGAGSTASSPAFTWTRVPLPAQGEPGNWVLADGSDVRHLAMAPDGTMYAYGEGLTDTLYKSADTGLGWAATGNVQDNIVDIAVSPHDSAFVYYATASTVYRSTDGGQTFGSLSANPGGAGTGNRTISAIDVTWAGGHVITAGIVDTDGGEYGGAYLLDEATGTFIWEDTGIGNYDVYDLAFSPNYLNDRQLVAAASDETDTFVLRKTGTLAWSADTGPARLNRDNAAVPVSVNVAAARLAFPDNYSSDITSPRCVVFVGIATGTGGGDVYRVTGAVPLAASPATDLNIGLAYGQSNLDIGGLAARGAFPATVITAGAADAATVYTSPDGGGTWSRSRKAPSGASVTSVLLPPAGAAAGLAYAATSGANSGLSVSRDTGDTWNQLSLIDTKLDAIVDVAPSPEYGQDATLFVLTFGSGHSLWRSTNGGAGWERVLSTGTAGVSSLSRVGLPPVYGANARTVFCAGDSGGTTTVWESPDNGQSYRRQPALDPVTGNPINIDAWAIAGARTLFIGSFDGSNGLVYRTETGGFFYSAGVRAGNQPLSSLAVSPAYGTDGTILAGTAAGRVYRSRNNGVSFRQLPGDAAAAPINGSATVAFDPGYGTNGTVYAAGDAADAGIHRFRTATATAWVEIDATLPAGGMINRLAFTDAGVLYAANAAADGGAERCLTPTSAGPAFDTVTRGLKSGATLNGAWTAGNRIWTIDTANNRLLRLDDTLTLPVTPAAPGDGASGTGRLANHTIGNVTLDWDTLAGATSYQWQCDDDAGFSAVAAGMEDIITRSSVRLPALQPAVTYYWRVRASAPAHSPWSETYSFTTRMDTAVIALRPDSPPPGATGVAVQPVFQWTAVQGANSYELLVATDMDFSRLSILRAGEHALPGNAWASDVSLEHGTTYYWKVRALAAGTFSPWSASGIFTTVAAPLPEPDPETGPPEPSPEITAPPETIRAFTLVPAAITATVTPTAPLYPPSPEEKAAEAAIPPALLEPQTAPAWTFYVIGSLLAIILLTLLVLLTVVIKLRLR